MTYIQMESEAVRGEDTLQMSSDSAKSPGGPRTGAPCPLEILNEFQMDIQDPGPAPRPARGPAANRSRDQGVRCCVGPGAPSWGGLGTCRGQRGGESMSASRRLKFFSSVCEVRQFVLKSSSVKRILRRKHQLMFHSRSSSSDLTDSETVHGVSTTKTKETKN